MKKIFLALLVISAMALALPISAKVDRVTEEGNWYLDGTYVIAYTCTSGCSGVYTHTMIIDSMDVDTGEFSGHGYYNPNNAYTWNVTGNITDSDITFHILYTGLNPGYKVDAIGTIDSDGNLSGTATGPGQAFTWQTTSGTALKEVIEYKNHGQYVKQAENKQEVAQSRIGMPVQSKGHTK